MTVIGSKKRTVFRIPKSSVCVVLLGFAIGSQSAFAADDCLRDQFTFQQAEDLFRSQQYLLSLMHFSALRASNCNSEIASRSWLGYSLTLNHLSEKSEALRTIETGLRHNRVQEKEKQSLRMVKTWINQEPSIDLTLEQKNRWELWMSRTNSESFQKTLEASSLSSSAQKSMHQLQHNLLQSRSKSPSASGVASAVIPGAGQAYVGTWQTAGISFVINAVLLGATLEFSRKDLPAAAAASAGVFSVTYLGNILSAVQSAHEFNRVARFESEEKLKSELLPELEL